MHSLDAAGGLSCDVQLLAEVPVGLVHVNVLVEAGALAPLGHDGQVRPARAAHEQQNVHVPREDSRGSQNRVKFTCSRDTHAATGSRQI